MQATGFERSLVAVFVKKGDNKVRKAIRKGLLFMISLGNRK